MSAARAADALPGRKANRNSSRVNVDATAVLNGRGNAALSSSNSSSNSQGLPSSKPRRRPKVSARDVVASAAVAVDGEASPPRTRLR